MAQKKCPKCGEDNPSEAVMCWACYTPLSGSAVAAAGVPGAASAPARAVAAPTRPVEEKEKKPVSPGLVGALALVVLVGLAMGLKALMTPEPTFEGPPPILPEKENPPAPSGPTGVGPAPPSGGVGVPLGTVPEPKAEAFQSFVLPNPRSRWGTMAIVPSNPELGPTQAAALAAFTLRQYSKSQMQQWERFYIFVFRDSGTAGAFRDYMNEHNGQPLLNADYEALFRLGVWGNAVVRLEYRNQREKALYPYRNPGSWWLHQSAGKV